MTTKLSKQWRKTINPLEYLDFYACSQEGLAKFERRMKARKSAPSWAVQTRGRLVSDGWQQAQPWVSEFALRSEVALFGLKFLYPEFSDRVTLYQKLLLDFLHRVLTSAPVDLPELQELHRLSSKIEFSGSEWKDLELVIRKRRAEFSGSPGEYAYLMATMECIGAVQNVCGCAPEQWWDMDVFAMPAKLTWLYEAREGERLLPIQRLEELRRSGSIQPVANAFLAALEYECPPPDWLPHGPG